MSFNEWKTYKLEELVEEGRGISYGVVQPGEFVESGGVPILKVNNLTERKTELKDVFRVTKEVEKKFSKTRLRGNELLVSVVGSLGHIHKVTEKEIGWNVVRAIAVLPLRQDVNRDWIYWCLRSPEVQTAIQNLATVTVQATLNIKELKKIEIPYPNSAVQQSIASILSSLDGKIQFNRRTNQTLEEIVRSLFKEWFVDFNFPNALNELVESEFGEIPKGWKIEKLGDILEVKGGTTPSTKEEKYWNGEFYWATPKDLSALESPILLNTERKITKAGVEQISSKILPAGTLLLSCRAPIGYLALSRVPISINQGFIAINGLSVSNLFMLFWLKENMATVVSRANGSTFLEISKSVFRNIDIIVPNKELLDHFDKIAGPLIEFITNNERESQTLTQLRDILLAKLMSGEIIV